MKTDLRSSVVFRLGLDVVLTWMKKAEEGIQWTRIGGRALVSGHPTTFSFDDDDDCDEHDTLDLWTKPNAETETG